MINPIKGIEAIIHHRAFLPNVPKSFCATSTTAQMVANKNGTQRPTKIAAVFIPMGLKMPDPPEDWRTRMCYGSLIAFLF